MSLQMRTIHQFGLPVDSAKLQWLNDASWPGGQQIQKSDSTIKLFVGPQMCVYACKDALCELAQKHDAYF